MLMNAKILNISPKEEIILMGRYEQETIPSIATLSLLKNVKLDPNNFQGYAFGIGIDRLAMLKYGINDLRAFFECDYRWLNHFGFDPLDVPTNYRGLSR